MVVVIFDVSVSCRIINSAFCQSVGIILPNKYLLRFKVNVVGLVLFRVICILVWETLSYEQNILHWNGLNQGYSNRFKIIRKLRSSIFFKQTATHSLIYNVPIKKYYLHLESLIWQQKNNWTYISTNDVLLGNCPRWQI